ncbi:MAG: TIGR02300 family protein [Alphaproteobacteria bacterium]|nr:TIGR02300 family protein [Alphaproteobacteria bacterium]
MSKPEWGTKRTCVECGEQFYDLNKDPIECPHCGKTLSLDDFLHQQANNVSNLKNKRGASKKREETESITDLEDFDEFEAEGGDVELMEDVSDLGDDENDMPSVSSDTSSDDKGEE